MLRAIILILHTELWVKNFLVSLHFALHQFKVSCFKVHMWRFPSPKILISLYMKSFWHWNTLLALLQNLLPENTQNCHGLFALKWILSLSVQENNRQRESRYLVYLEFCVENISSRQIHKASMAVIWTSPFIF